MGLCSPYPSTWPLFLLLLLLLFPLPLSLPLLLLLFPLFLPLLLPFKHLTSEKALLKQKYISGGREQRTKLQPKIASYSLYYNINPHQINHFKTFFYSVPTYSRNHCTCPQSSSLLGQLDGNRLYWKEFHKWLCCRYTCKNKKVRLEQWGSENEYRIIKLFLERSQQTMSMLHLGQV